LGKFQVVLNDEAAADFEELASHKVFGELAKRYLKELNDFPPEGWGDVHRKDGQGYFKSDHHVVFDIQGKLMTDGQGFVMGVKISRFRLRRRG